MGQTRMADFSSHRTDEDVELTQLGALKTLLREALASTRDIRAAAADARAAAADARSAAISSAAAFSAIASLCASIDSMQQTTTAPAIVTATAAAVVEAVTAALGKPCGAALELAANQYSDAPLSRRTVEVLNSVRGARDRGGSDSLYVKSQAASLCGTARERESPAGIPSAETVAAAMAISALDTFRSYRPHNPADCSSSARGHPPAAFDQGQRTVDDRVSLDGTDLGRGLGSLLDSAMHPVRLELERLRAIMIDVRGGLNSSRSTAPPPHMPLPHSPHFHATTLQPAAATAIAISATSTPRDSPRRRLRLVGKARNPGATPYSTRTGSHLPGDAGGGVEVNGIGLISWLMGPGRRLEPSDPGPAVPTQIHPPPSLLPAT